MNKKKWFIAIAIGMVLVVSGGMLAFPPSLQSGAAEPATTVDDALLATLTGHLKWETLQGTADIIWYGPAGETQTYTSTFAIQQPDKINLSIVDVEGTEAGEGWISDGETAYSINYEAQTYSEMSLPAFSTDLSMLPATLEEAKTANAIYRHPFGMLIPYPVGDYLYPQWFSQGGGTYSLSGEEIFLGRKVWVIEHQKNGQKVSAWIDQESGVILKYIQHMDENLYLEMIFTSFHLNTVLDEALFSLPAGY